uniref:AAA+ ATPase domain-containing protein n=1 Tax=Salix viminalis TaxID=40686 RepID=A0A6N2L250_SALVM
MTEVWATMGSTIASFMFIWAIIRQYCPYEVRFYFAKYTQRIMSFFYPYIKISIHEYTGDRLERSEAYAAVEAYLSINSSKCAKRLKAEMAKDCSSLVLSMDEYERVKDEFQGIQVWWVSSMVMPLPQAMYPQQERRYYRLTFHKRYREIIAGAYLKHVMQQGKEIRVRHRQRKLYTNDSGNKWQIYKQTPWSHIVFEHPATFETLAMEPAKKEEIIEDLVTFSKSKDFYGRIGKAWKRGYLLYGPPGTGKSTMIAAMANLLSYDVYDLELTAVKDNTELRKLLIETTSKSIIVIEDIDCSLDLTGQRTNKREEKSPDEIRKEQEESSSKVTLSGLLNFIDGLWSACGEERLIVFEAFKVLSRNYLRLEAHPLFDRIESLMKETTITPADVAENLMPKSPLDAADKCLSRLIQVLEETKAAAAEATEKDEKEASTKNAQSSTKAAEVPAMEDAACPTTRKLSPTSQNMK